MEKRVLEANVTLRRPDHRPELRVRGTVIHDGKRHEFSPVADLEVLQTVNQSEGIHESELEGADRDDCESALYEAFAREVWGEPSRKVQQEIRSALCANDLSTEAFARLNALVERVGWRAVVVAFERLERGHFLALVESIEKARAA